MASHHEQGDSGLLRGSRTRSYGSLSQSSYSPARIRKIEHRVQPGDTLQGLALKYGVTMEQIKRANRLYTNDSIFLKKYLSIPVLAEQPDLSNGLESHEKSGEEGIQVKNPSARKDRKDKNKPHRTGAKSGNKEELSASDFMSRLDTSIRVSKRAAAKKLREAETLVPKDDSMTAGATVNQRPHTGSREASPQTQQRSLLGPVPLTVTTRASAIKDHEDEIFKL
ncbi:lysM and putative peptidoglycan-binding domain-containing protein 1 [Spea bombifrons]|uniref:lysM and putative peptidoglycan-binding domain-containing protein 1 n=1 Tax=Spea bombifrons TaxID=233779 RepID=UPI002349ED22|nr:lysM and putative peptidoglycan-binding domain-containing protein 1 [Spea bombifrons]